MAGWAEWWKAELIGRCFTRRGTPPGCVLPPQASLLWLTGAVQRKASVRLEHRSRWYPSPPLYMSNPGPRTAVGSLEGRTCSAAQNIWSRGSNIQDLPPSQTSCSRDQGQTELCEHGQMWLILFRAGGCSVSISGAIRSLTVNIRKHVGSEFVANAVRKLFNFAFYCRLGSATLVFWHTDFLLSHTPDPPSFLFTLSNHQILFTAYWSEQKMGNSAWPRETYSHTHPCHGEPVWTLCVHPPSTARADSSLH